MPRTTHLVLAAGIAGAVFAGLVNSAVSVPASAGLGAADPQPKVGTVDVLLLLEQMLDGEPYAAARDAAAKAWNDQIQPLVSQRDDVVQSLSGLGQDDPGAQGLYQQFQGLEQRIRQLSQEAEASVDQTSAEQLADAYKKIHAAVGQVAAEHGYDRVFSSRMSVDEFNAENTNVVVQEVLLRPVLANTPGHDLTDLVRESLNIPEPAEEEAGPAPEQPQAPEGEGGGG